MLILSIDDRSSVRHHRGYPALTLHPIAVLAPDHQSCLVDLAGYHIAPVIEDVIEKNPIQRAHILRCEGLSETVEVLERRCVVTVVEINQVGVHDECRFSK